MEVADLLKNFLHQHQIKSLKDDWKAIVGNAAQSMLRMLKFFYIANRGPVQKAELYKKLRRLADDFGDKGLFVKQLLIFSEYYAYAASIGTNTETTKDYFASNGFTGIATHQDRFTEVHLAMQALKSFQSRTVTAAHFRGPFCVWNG